MASLADRSPVRSNRFPWGSLRWGGTRKLEREEAGSAAAPVAGALPRSPDFHADSDAPGRRRADSVESCDDRAAPRPGPAEASRPSADGASGRGCEEARVRRRRKGRERIPTRSGSRSGARERKSRTLAESSVRRRSRGRATRGRGEPGNGFRRRIVRRTTPNRARGVGSARVSPRSRRSRSPGRLRCTWWRAPPRCPASTSRAPGCRGCARPSIPAGVRARSRPRSR